MKKIFIVLAMLFVVGMVNAGDSTDVNWADVADKMIDKTDMVVTKLSASIEEIAPKAWEIAHKQVLASAISDMALFVILSIITIFLTLHFKSLGDKAGCDDTPYYFIASFVGTIALVVIIAAIVCISDGIKMLINPDYYAIQKIFEIAGQL